jgi:hypothetical protein
MGRNKRYVKRHKDHRRLDEEIWENNGFGGDDRGVSLSLELNNKRSAWASVFSKVCSIVSGRNVEVKFSKGVSWNWNSASANPPAWTDGENIYLNNRSFDEIINRTLGNQSSLEVVNELQSLKGLTYHELAHVIFTPRHTQKPTSIIRKLDKDPAKHPSVRYWAAYNILEDQRIETFFSARYPIAAHYFVRTVSEFLLKNFDSDVSVNEMVHLLTHGRKYLPLALRKSARDLFIKREVEGLNSVMIADKNEADAKYLEAIIDEYRTLYFPKDSKRAVELVKKFAQWVAQQAVNVPDISSDHGHQREGSSDGQVSQREVSEAVQEQDDQQDEEEAKSNAGGDNSDTSDSDDDGSTADGDAAGTSDDDKSPEDTAKDVLDSARKILDEVSKTLRSDAINTIKQVSETMASSAGSGEGGLGNAAHALELPVDGVKMQSRRIGEVLAQLQFDAEPHYDRRLPKGRLNVVAAMESSAGNFPSLDIFDEWQEGEDTTSVEVVILLDLSVSMSRMINGASHAMWAIKSACEKAGIDCTVIGYSDRSKTLINSRDRVGTEVPVFQTEGGTQASSAIHKAENIFRNTENRHKILISITDGEWSEGNDTIKKLMAPLHQMGVHSHLVYLLSSYGYGVIHDPEYAAARVEGVWEDLKRNEINHHESATVAIGVPEALKKVSKYLLGVVGEAAINASM